MSRAKEIKTLNMEKRIMDKVRSNQITMKPHWYFVVGSALSAIGFVSFTVGAIYLINLMLFLSRRHGPMGQFRLQLMLESFPWWIPLLALVGIIGGIIFLKKYDFSYKKNIGLLIVGFIISIILAAFVIDYLGLNDLWSRQGPMRGFYRQIQNENNSFPGNGFHNRQRYFNK